MTPSSSPADPIPVAVVGCGRMGRLHARVWSQMPQVRLVGVADANPAAAAAVAREFGTQAVPAEQLLSRARAVTIAVPTQQHMVVARPFIERSIACLIEKPLAPDSATARQLADLARQHRAVVQVGHTERFNPAIRALRGLELAPRFIETVRVSPLTFRSIDVGVVLDMMIHDLDIVLKLAGSRPLRVEASAASVIGGVEDVCSARVTFANGCVAALSGSRLALKTDRRLRVICRDQYIAIDYQKKEAVRVRREGTIESIRAAVAEVRGGADPTQLSYKDLVKLELLPIEDKEPLRAQAESFLAAVAGQQPPEVSAEDGQAAVELAEKILAAAGDSGV